MHVRCDDADGAVAAAAAYYEAMVESDGERLRQLFHERAIIAGHFGDGLELANLEEFISSTVDAKNGDGPFDYRLERLEMVGDTAVVTVGGYSYGRWFTDHLTMLKIEGRWLIMNKTFFCHPEGYKW